MMCIELIEINKQIKALLGIFAAIKLILKNKAKWKWGIENDKWKDKITI